MSNVFSWQRFCHLLAAHWSESRKHYLGFLLMISVVDVILLLLFFGDTSHSYPMLRYETQTVWYTAGLFVTGSVFAGIHFRPLTEPGAELILLMRPASVYEKWLQAILVVSVLYPLAYTALYCLLNYPVVQLASAWYVPQNNCKNCDVDFSFYFPLLTSGLPKASGEAPGPAIGMQLFTLMAFWIVQALLLAGTVFFRQSTVLRTTLVLFLLWIGLLVHLPPPAMAFWRARPEEWAIYSTAELTVSALVWPGLLCLLWLTLLFNLREREVS